MGNLRIVDQANTDRQEKRPREHQSDVNRQESNIGLRA